MKRLLSLICIVAIGVMPMAYAKAGKIQKGKKPPKKSQGAPKKDGPVVLGTNQLPGEFGVFGRDYTIGTEAPLNFNLVSAEYRADRFVGENSVGELASWIPLKSQKLLVLKYTVQNPNNRDTRLWYLSFKLIAVSADDQNTQQVNLPWVGNNTKYQDMQLKPAQKVTLTAAILVPAEGEVPKLIVQRGFDDKAAVVRYDLRGKVAKIKDSAWSADGFTTNDTIDAKLDTYYPWNGADIQINGIDDSLGSKFADLKAERGQKLIAIKLKARGVTPVFGRVWYGQFSVRLKTSDGETTEVRPYSNLFRGGREENFDGVVPNGEEQGLRLIAAIPEGVRVEGLTLTYKYYDEIRRVYSFKLN